MFWKWIVVVSVIGNIAYFFSPHLLIFWIYAVGSKLLNLGKVLLWKIIFYIVCEKKFCRYVWENLFQKSSIEEYRDENLVISDISNRNKLAMDIFRKCERAKK